MGKKRRSNGALTNINVSSADTCKRPEITDLNCPRCRGVFSAIGFSSVASQTAISGSGRSPTLQAECAMSALLPIADISGQIGRSAMAISGPSLGTTWSALSTWSSISRECRVHL